MDLSSLIFTPRFKSLVRGPWSLVLLFMICLFLRAPSFWIPMLDIDESQFAIYANTLLDGGRPYIDSIDTKPLGIYWFFALTFKFFGKNNLIAVHLVTAFWVFLTAFFCLKIASRLKDEEAGFFAALFYIVSTTTYIPKYLSTSVVLLMMLPLTMSIYCLILWEERGRRTWLFLSGLLFGVGCLFKYQAGIRLLLGFIFIFFLSQRSKSIVHSPLSIVHFFIYFLAASLVGLMFAAYLKGAGVLEDFVFWSFKGSYHYLLAGYSAANILRQVFMRVGSFVAFTFFLWFFGFKELFSFRGEDPKKNLISLSFLLNCIPVAAGLRFYGHYFIQLLPSLSILSALAFTKKRWRPAWIIWGLALPALGCFAARGFISPIHDFWGEENLKRYEPIGKYAASLTSSQDSIYVWGFASPIYLDADRKPASRFIWSDWQTGRVGGFMNGPSKEESVSNTQTKRAWRLLFEDLEKDKPLYFLDTAPGNYHGYGKYPVSRYPELAEYLEGHYFLESNRFGVDFYKRKK